MADLSTRTRTDHLLDAHTRGGGEMRLRVLEPQNPAVVDVPLGEFDLARLLHFVVLGDGWPRPSTVDLYAMVADEPLHLLHIEDVDLLGTGASPRMAWTEEGGLESGSAFATILYGETIRVLQRARSAQARANREAALPDAPAADGGTS